MKRIKACSLTRNWLNNMQLMIRITTGNEFSTKNMVHRAESQDIWVFRYDGYTILSNICIVYWMQVWGSNNFKSPSLGWRPRAKALCCMSACDNCKRKMQLQKYKNNKLLRLLNQVISIPLCFIFIFAYLLRRLAQLIDYTKIIFEESSF